MRLQVTATETVEPLAADDDRLLLRVVWEGGHDRPPLHFHPGHDEVFEVLSGTLAVTLGSWTELHRPGARVRAPRGTPHTMWPVDGPVEATWECRPPGRVLAWFTELDALTTRGYRGPALAVARAALAGRYDDVFRLAAPPRPLVQAGLRALAALTGRSG